MEKRTDATSVFILPPSYNELERRLRSRKSDSPEQVEKRLKTALAEMNLASQYQYQIKNDNINQAVRELVAIKETACQTLSSE
jgi:guanylate kinase